MLLGQRGFTVNIGVRSKVKPEFPWRVMRIGELAAQAGVTTDTVRFYEKVGLVTGTRLANGYRDFPPGELAWLRYVRVAQALGFSLAEITQSAAELREAPDTAQALSELFQDKIRVIDARIEELSSLRADLSARAGTVCPLQADLTAALARQKPASRPGK